VSPSKKAKCGRKKKTTPTADAYLTEEIKKNPRKTSFQLQQDLLASARASV